MFVPVNRPFINNEEIKNIKKSLRSGWISADSKINKKFEKEFSKKVNRKYSVAVSSGTAAIDIAIKSINIKKGDEVIIPTFTIISTIAEVIRSGAKPILVDADQDTWNINTKLLEKKITKKTKAIMVVHIYGIPTNLDIVLKIAKKYKLYVIEDAAEQLGQTYKGKPIGSFGDISIFSFFVNKHITTGEGGMISTNKKNFNDKFLIYRNLSFNPKKQKFIHDDLGWNYRMTSMQAAMGLAQLKKLNKFVKKKRSIGKKYNKAFQNIKSFKLPITSTSYAQNIYWVYGLISKSKKYDAKKCINILKKKGVECRPFFCPMHLQPVFKKMKLFKDESFPVSEKLFKYGFYIPCGLANTDKEINYVIKVIKKLFN